MIAVIFEANSHLDKQARYLDIASELKPLLEQIDGFIAIERFQSLSETGKILSLSWWRDEESVLAWKKNVFHQQAQAEGRASIFSYYRIRVARVLRDYSSENRGE
ncbi:MULTISPECIES: antibiotic biosynthesis monooxygenase family protein [Hafnia]|uniref:Antibiotic biosynthesis monooxygenase n=1 Tax=Hafnia paralvei TaxID=546367 RepID=A0A4Q9EHB1_9GAMM|nr:MULTISPECIES: antibiotic biosynthesis monooxygenase [Hafnia]OFS08890.1 antibiotic biosynthesis monooxygenase [Hafnia sp. HMSC23F03]TBM23124.1 antibiotic biosynthesis monooxygenase [Hafnia paralvei]